MKITLAQIKLRNGDFDYNFDSVRNALQKSSGDIVILPQCDIESIGGKDLILDAEVQQAQCDFYEKIAKTFPCENILLGDIFITNGEVLISKDGYYSILGKKIYVSDTYEEDVECDLYVLAHNRYFAMNTYSDFIDNIQSKSDLVYINALALADESVYAGGSFAKNPVNKIVHQSPLCKEEIVEVDFAKTEEFNDIQMEAQVLDVIKFALKEYCDCAGFKKVILGLSGGIDSALTAALAVEALGNDNVFGVLMPSMFSSQGSVDDALALAKNLGIKTAKEPITELFNSFMTGRESLHDLAEENLQARLRGLILMFYSNRENMLLLSTGNKSEAAMGFGTLYGDLAGGYNLICDLTKKNVYKLANYINRNGEIIPQNSIDKAPSAELHPNQKDSDRLPEYEILDEIIEMYLEKRCPMSEIYEKYDKKIVDEVIRKIYRFQFKRKQCCLGIRLSENSFTSGVNLPVVQRFF